MQTFSQFFNIIEEGWKATVKQYDLSDKDKAWVERIMDPLGTMKYAPWFVKTVVVPGVKYSVNLQHPLFADKSLDQFDKALTEMFEVFNKYQNSHKKDINSFKTFADFQDFLVPYFAKEHQKQMKKQLVKQGHETLVSNKWFDLYLVKTHEASCKLGMRGVWCTTRDNPHHWNLYTRDHETSFGYLVFKEKNDSFIGEAMEHYGLKKATYSGVAQLMKKIAIQFDDYHVTHAQNHEVEQLYAVWDAENNKDQSPSVEFIDAVVEQEWNKIIPKVKEFITSGEKSDMLKDKAVKAIEMLADKTIDFETAKPHLDAFGNVSGVTIDADGITMDMSNRESIPLYVFDHIVENTSINNQHARQLYIAGLNIFDLIPEQFVKKFKIDGQTVADITTYQISPSENKMLTKLLKSRPFKKTLQYRDKSSQPALADSFDNNNTIALNFEDNKFLQASIPGGMEMTLGASIQDDFLKLVELNLKRIFSENLQFVISWKDFYETFNRESDYTLQISSIKSVLRSAIEEDIENTKLIMPDVIGQDYIRKKALDFRNWMDREMLEMRKDHNVDEFEYWIDKWDNDFMILISSRGKGEYFWHEHTYPTEDAARKVIEDNTYFESIDPDIYMIQIKNLETGELTLVWEEAEIPEEYTEDYTVPDDFVWWDTRSRAGYTFVYPPKPGSWADNFIKFLQTEPEDNTVQGFYNWLGRGVRAHSNMADFFTAIKDSGIVAGELTGPRRTYRYTIGPNYELWKAGKLGVAYKDKKWGPKVEGSWGRWWRESWRNNAWQNISKQYQSYKERPTYNTEAELKANAVYAESFAQYMESINMDQTSQKMSRNHRGGAVVNWIDPDDDWDFEGVEDDLEEEEMLEGEPRARRSPTNAYGGPLPPS